MSIAPSPIGVSAVELSHGLRRRWWIVLVLAVVGAVAGAGFSMLAPPRYAATVTLMVQLPNSAADTETLVRTVEALPTSSVVLDDLSRSPGVDLTAAEVGDRLEIERPPGSAIVQISAVDTSRERAGAIARELVPIVEERVGRMSLAGAGTSIPIRVESFGGRVQVSNVDRGIVRNGVLGFGAGAMIGLLLAVGLSSRRPTAQHRER